MTESIIVFSHPNHETAILGSLMRMQAPIVFLTDGGGEARVNQTHEGLGSIARLENAHFLNHKEDDLYDALLDGRTDFYRALADQVADIFGRYQPQRIYCDAVEFYNPVHDMSLPIVQVAAAKSAPTAAIFEIPLIYQTQAEKESYVLQRVPVSLEADAVWVELTNAELDKKVNILCGNIYSILHAQMKGMIRESLPQAGREQFLKARTELPRPVAGQRLRYDERGLAHRSAGLVREAITYERHYVPMYRCLRTL
jgi:hypothetical protein